MRTTGEAMAAGDAGGATGTFTVTIVRPGATRPGAPRPVAEHWAYGEREAALADLGPILDRTPPGTELVLRDPEGLDLLRVARLA